MTVAIARPPLEDTLSGVESLASDLYEAPVAEVEHVERGGFTGTSLIRSS